MRTTSAPPCAATHPLCGARRRRRQAGLALSARELVRSCDRSRSATRGASRCDRQSSFVACDELPRGRWFPSGRRRRSGAIGPDDALGRRRVPSELIRRAYRAPLQVPATVRADAIQSVAHARITKRALKGADVGVSCVRRQLLAATLATRSKLHHNDDALRSSLLSKGETRPTVIDFEPGGP